MACRACFLVRINAKYELYHVNKTVDWEINHREIFKIWKNGNPFLSLQKDINFYSSLH